MLLNSEDVNSPVSSLPSLVSSVQSIVDERWNTNTMIDQEPLPLLATPNIGQHDLCWLT